jgi:hypothetical protein
MFVSGIVGARLHLVGLTVDIARNASRIRVRTV